MSSRNDIITIHAPLPVTRMMDKAEDILKAHGFTIYARIDQRAEAMKDGLSLNPIELLVFGKPKGGAPLMNVNALSGLDLPLKILVWEDVEENVWLSYNSFAYLQKRFDLPEELMPSVATVEYFIQQITGYS